MLSPRTLNALFSYVLTTIKEADGALDLPKDADDLGSILADGEDCGDANFPQAAYERFYANADHDGDEFFEAWQAFLAKQN